MTYTINIISKTREGALYDEVALNKYPIVYISDCTPDELFEQRDLVDAIRRKVLTSNVYGNAKICVRCIDEKDEVSDLLFILKDKIRLDFNDGDHDNGRMGPAHELD